MASLETNLNVTGEQCPNEYYSVGYNLSKPLRRVNRIALAPPPLYTVDGRMTMGRRTCRNTGRTRDKRQCTYELQCHLCQLDERR